MVFLVVSVSDGPVRLSLPLMFIPAVFKTQMIFVLLLLYYFFLCDVWYAPTHFCHTVQS